MTTLAHTVKALINQGKLATCLDESQERNLFVLASTLERMIGILGMALLELERQKQPTPFPPPVQEFLMTLTQE